MTAQPMTEDDRRQNNPLPAEEVTVASSTPVDVAVTRSGLAPV